MCPVRRPPVRGVLAGRARRVRRPRRAAAAEPLPAVQVLGIDWGHLPLAGATRRGKPVWAKDPETGRWRIVQDRWHTGIVDAAGTGGLLAHVNGRTATTVADWLIEQPEQWRAGVTHVWFDLSASSLRAVTTALPDAVVVADRFHLVQLANDMLTELRQRVTREDRGRRGRKKDPEWASRRRLLTGRERLTPDTFARMWNGLIDQGDLGIEILHAYALKENLRQLLALAPTPGTSVPDRSVISHRCGASLTSPPPPTARSPPPRRHHRDLVASGRGRHHHRLLQRPIGGLQPARQTRRTQRLRLPEHHQPAPTHTLGMHSSTPTSISQNQRDARSSSMSH